MEPIAVVGACFNNGSVFPAEAILINLLDITVESDGIWCARRPLESSTKFTVGKWGDRFDWVHGFFGFATSWLLRPTTW